MKNLRNNQAESGVRMDRRCLKTQKAIKNALVELMSEKDISQITVKELAQRADINRKTFYTHYTSIYDVSGEIENEITGLTCGADDYLPKPFDVREFLARVRSLTRRGGTFTPQILTVGNISLNRSTFELSSGGTAVRLGNKEFQMMELLMRRQGQFISTEQFMERIWGYECDSEINVVWAYISYLRRRLASLGADVKITASRGRGYMLEAEGGQ